MTENELRIGNWVRHDSNWSYRQPDQGPFLEFDFRWNERDWYAIGESTLLMEQIDPIPLTEEWLFKLGYTRCTDEHLSERSGNLYEKHTIYYSPEYEHDLHYVDESYGGTHEFHWKYFIGWDSLIQVTHVHQLQNLYYALTNKEL